jgi:peptidoglycan/LPS O-acetylase OafA/YrhL
VRQSASSPIGSPRRWQLDEAAPRIVAFDYLRGIIVVLVVLHHSVLAYTRFSHFDRLHYLWSSAPIVDASKWLGFDLIVLFNDSYFMPLMFLLSGLFVWPSLTRKGSLHFAQDRLLRLAVPFAVAVVSVVPVAYYPSFRMTGASAGFGRFWMEMVSHGPWPSGPAWFLCVLLAFDLAAAAVHPMFRRPAVDGASNVTLRPLQYFGFLVAMSAIGFLPLLMVAGPSRWLSFGPFAVQASRIGLYGVYFLAGILAGRHGPERFSEAAAGASVWQWPLSAGLLYFGFVALQSARSAGLLTLPQPAWSGAYGLFIVLFCAVATFAWFAIVSRFLRRPTPLGDSLAANAYGVYLLHYAAVIWLQYALLVITGYAIVKATLVFIAALLLSWGCTSVLRQVPGVARVL